jgi:hypothetical protein
MGEAEARLAEYAALRAEILKRLEIRYQLLTFTMIATGGFAAIALTDMPSPTVMLLQPIFATLIAAAWAHSDLRIEEIGQYLKDQEGGALAGTGWQTHLSGLYGPDTSKVRKELSAWYGLGVFLVTEVLGILVAVSLRLGAREVVFSNDALFAILLVVDVVCLGVTWVIVRLRRSKYVERTQGA